MTEKIEKTPKDLLLKNVLCPRDFTDSSPLSDLRRTGASPVI